ncbi:MAG: insulinase family protein [Acidobacteriales bacterium]|nr:insulinase family protein [Terriglobales bacterium]
MTADKRNIQRHVLPNGVTVLTEEMGHLRSVSIGVWVKSGSRHEEASVNGISHFIEHMVFKGTKTRTAVELARIMDSVGGHMDAFTSKENICFHAKVLDEHVPLALDILSDLALNPVFDPKDIEREQGVICEEIKMDEDNPDYLVQETFTQNYWKDHQLGRPILGTKETVRKFDREVLHEYYRERFSPRNLVISAAGSLDHKRFVQMVKEKFGGMTVTSNGLQTHPPKANPRIITRNKKALAQVQICLGVPSVPIADEKRYHAYMLSTILGGGMSSRLFQKIREEQGLAYSIFSDLSPFVDTGVLLVNAGTSREAAPKVVQQIVEEFRRIKNDGVPEEELHRVKEQMKGSLVLSLESSSSRMMNLARQEIYFDRFFDLDEILERVEEVRVEDVAAMAKSSFLSDAIAVTVLGNLNGMKFTRSSLAC